MWLNLVTICSVLLLLGLLCSQAESGRVKFVARHGDLHRQHHGSSSQVKASKEALKANIEMVTNAKHPKYNNFDIGIVTATQTTPYHQHHDMQELVGMLDTPVSGPNPGGNSENLAVSTQKSLSGRTLATRNLGGNTQRLVVSGPNPGGNSDTLTTILDTPVSGPNPGGNSNTLTTMLDTPVSGPNPGGNSNTLAGMLDTPVSGPNPGGNSQTLSVSLDTKSLGNMLDTPVSGPNPGGNSQSLLVLGPNAGTPKSLLVSGADAHANAEMLTVKLDTLVSGLNPGGNSQSLAVSGPNPGGNAVSLANMLDTPVSTPNSGSNSQSLVVSGPNPGGNGAKSLGNMLDTPVSGPNRGGNSQILAVSGPNPGGNSNTLAANMLDIPFSGPNPGGNSHNLGSVLYSTSVPSSCGVSCGDEHITSMLDTPVSGPNPGSNSATLGNVLDVPVSEMSSAGSGPNPGSNSQILQAAKVERGVGRSLGQSSKLAAAFGSNLSQRAEVETLFSELPKAPVPPSGPSPNHNSVVTQQGLFAMRMQGGVLVGCDEDEGASASSDQTMPSRRFQHLEPLINSINSMGSVRVNSS